MKALKIKICATGEGVDVWGTTTDRPMNQCGRDVGLTGAYGNRACSAFSYSWPQSDRSFFLSTGDSEPRLFEDDDDARNGSMLQYNEGAPFNLEWEHLEEAVVSTYAKANQLASIVLATGGEVSWV
jgi:hypothetical protein